MTEVKAWEAFENYIADVFHGKRQVGSGLSPIASKKGDVETDTFLIECKCTSKPVYHLQAKTFQKIVEQALQAQKTPLMAIKTCNGVFMLSLEIDDVEPKNFKVSETSTHAPYINISTLAFVEATVYKTMLSIATKTNKILYPICLWRMEDNYAIK